MSEFFVVSLEERLLARGVIFFIVFSPFVGCGNFLAKRLIFVGVVFEYSKQRQQCFDEHTHVKVSGVKVKSKVHAARCRVCFLGG